MKKFLFCLFVICSLSAFAIPDFQGVNWGDSKSSLELLFPKLEKEVSTNKDIEIYSQAHPKEFVSKYQLFLDHGKLYKIRVIFDKETVGREEIQEIYAKLQKDFGTPMAKVAINQSINDFSLRGNSIKFLPDRSTALYFIGIDTIDNHDSMIDSNLYLEYVDINKE